MAGAAALSLGMLGTFALPAYASVPQVEGQPDGFTQSAPAQTLRTVDVDAAVVPLQAPEGEVSAAILEQEREAAAAAEAEAKAKEAASKVEAAEQRTASGVDIPAGVGGQGIANAALAQLGVFQDCTALVEKSLRAVGIPAGDLGTQTYEYTALGGVEVTGGDYAPGDILIWPGAHVAVYIGNGQAVHGGWNGNQTVVAGVITTAGGPSAVVRFG